MNTCLNCRHWQTTKIGKSGEPEPAPLLQHKLAACTHGENWHYLPARHTCSKHQAISQPALQRREDKIAELQKGNRS